MKPKVIIVRGPGTNCDMETAHAFKEEGAQSEIVHINVLKKDPRMLETYSILAIPGGFTYGDDISAGKILANEMALFLKEALKDFVRRKKLIIGICNGFQVLVKTGILPDMDFSQKVTLTRNNSLKFEARWVSMRVEKDCLWTAGMRRQVIMLPIAHGEGKFMASAPIVRRLENGGTVVLRYVTDKGKHGEYPSNPNGSVNDIAGIVDSTGRVFGLMPHPERFFYETQHPFYHLQKARGITVVPWGRLILRNAVDYVRGHSRVQK